MKKQGIINISATVYRSDMIDDALFGLKIKVFKVEYDTFKDVYTIWFTSPYIDEVEEGSKIPTYNLEVGAGFKFIKVENVN